MQLERFEAKGLAHYSYVVASQGQAVIVDPERNIDVYLRYLESQRLHLAAVLETHIHADYASGAPALAAAANARLLLSAYDKNEDFVYSFPHEELEDHEEIEAGGLRIAAYHTPGHTPEHLSFLVYEKSRCGQPLALFSGDLVFAGSLGRPDLLGEEAKRRLAAELYRSVHERIENLPDGLLVYPAHGAGSLCGANLSDRPYTTLGYERFCNIFLADKPEAEFVDQILSTVPEFPDYYRRMKELNSRGAPPLPTLPGAARLKPGDIKDDWQVVDIRRGEAFAGAHIPGSINIGGGPSFGPSFGLWAPWVLEPNRPIALVGEDAASLEDARRSLVRAGLDDIRGSLDGGIGAWLQAGRAFSTTKLQPASEWKDAFVIDVRSPSEYAVNHLPGAINIPAGDMPKRAAEFQGREDVAVICGSGYRSSIAASILQKTGVRNVINLAGGMGSRPAGTSCSLR
jgi:hydroxyacylglutathione hydrolase